MKSILIASVLSLAIGVTAGWMIKSASGELDTITQLPPTAPIERRPPVAPAPSETLDQVQLPATPAPIPQSTDKIITKDDVVIPESAKRVDQAKWMRLGEVLHLTSEQSKAIAATLEESKITPKDGETLDATYQRTGELLEKNILAILDPSQQDAFREFQQRALDSQVEVAAQKTLSEEIGSLDLTPAQRDQALALLREDSAADFASISPATRLVLFGSILPIGNEKFRDEGILLLRELDRSANGATMEGVAAIQRAKIAAKLSRYEGILTPAQLESYRASLGESLENLNIISPP